MGSFRKGIILQLDTIMAIVNVETAIAREASNKQVCIGEGFTPHVPSPISQRTHCPHCGEVSKASLKKAAVQGDQYVLLEEDEIADVKAEVIADTKKVVHLSVHRSEDVQAATLATGSTYALVPSEPFVKPIYGLLVDALSRNPQVTVLGLWTPTSRPNLYEVKLHGDTLVMAQLARPEDIQVTVQERLPIPEANQQKMDQVLQNLTEPFDPNTYSDVYRERISALVASKDAVAGEVQERVKGTPKPSAGVVDLTAMLDAQLSAMAS